MAGQQQIGVAVVAVGIAAFSRAMRTAQDDLERTVSSVNKLTGQSGGLGSALTALGGNMQRLGRAMLIDVTAPIGILTATLVNAGIEFEDAFAGIGKTVEGVAVGFDEIKNAAEQNLGRTITTMDEAKAAAEEMGMAFGDLTPVGEDVRNQFRQMALDIPMAATDLANLGEIVGQLGVEAPEIANVTKLVAELGVATDLSAEDAAFGLIRMANIMESTVGPNAISMEEFIRRAGSALVDLGNKSVATEGEILNFALRLSAAGDIAKMTEQEVLAWATTLADLGARAESGGTAVSRALNEMLLAVKTGSPNLAIFAKTVGMTGAQFQKAFEEDASKALEVFTKSLGEGIEAGNITKKNLTDMGLGGIRAADIMLRLSDAQEIFNKNLTNANTAWDEAIALEEEAEKRFGTFKSQLQILKNTFVDLGISIFDLVKGDLEVLVNMIKGALNWFKGLDDGLKKNIIIFGALAAAIGPLLIVFGGLVSLLGAASTAISAVGVAALPVIGILVALGAAIAAATGFNMFGGKKPAVAPTTESKAPDSKQAGAGSLSEAQQLFGINQDIAETDKATQEATDSAEEFDLVWKQVAVPVAVENGISDINRLLEDTPELLTAAEVGLAELAGGPPVLFTYEWVQVKVPKEPEQPVPLVPDSEHFKEQMDKVLFAPTPIEIFIDETGIQTTIDNIKRNLLSIGESILGLNIPDIIADSGILGSISTLKDFLVTSFTGGLTTTLDDLRTAADNFTLAIKPFIEDQGPNLEKIFKNLGLATQNLQPLFESIGRLFGAIFGKGDPEKAGASLGKMAGVSLDTLVSSIATLSDKLPGFIDSMTAGIDTLTGVIEDLKIAFGPLVETLLSVTGEDLTGAWGSLKIAWDNLMLAAAPLAELFEKVMPYALALVGAALIAVVSIITFVILIISNLALAVSVAFQSIGKIVGGIATYFQGLVTIVEGVIGVIGNMFSAVAIFFGFFYDLFTVGLDQAIANFMVRIWGWKDDLLESFNTIIEGGKTAFTGLFQAISGVIEGNINGIVVFFLGLANDVKQVFTDLFNDLVGHSIIPDMMTAILESFINVKDSILGVVTDLVSGVSSMFASIKSPTFSGASAGVSSKQAPTDAGGGEGGDVAAMLNVQQLAALQAATIALQEVWAGFGVTVSTTLTSVNETLAALTNLTKTLYTAMSASFATFFVIPTLAEIAIFSAAFVLQINLLSTFWREICLGLVKSWLDFTANAAKLTPGFVDGVIGEFKRMRDNSSGQVNGLANDFLGFFASNGSGSQSLEFFGQGLSNTGGKFGKLKSAVGSFVDAMTAEMLSLCDTAADVMNCLTASPELKIQHPFERFEKYIKSTSYGDLISKSMSIPELESISTIVPNLQGNTTTIDRSISNTITGLPITTAEDLANTLERQVRMSEVMQGA